LLVHVTDPRQRLAFPLDYPDLAAARRGAELVCRSAGVLKVGLELFVKEGPATVRIGAEVGSEIFLDLKLHDIPATIDAAVASAVGLGVRYLTVHACGGPAMIEAAVKRAEREGTGTTILAVTVLTSLDDADMRALGVGHTASEQALLLARLAHSAGARGFVCSPAEVSAIRAALGADVVLVTPGIRSASSATGDQKRTGTPAFAIEQGASVLVVGRPIREANDPGAAAEAVLEEIRAATQRAARS
jgi:orotidine-5'-phosphate decarboxylase